MQYSLIENNGSVLVTEKIHGNVIEKIEPHLYEIYPSQHGLFLKKVGEKFELPEKIFGKEVAARTTEVGNTWTSVDTNVGCLLIGSQGSGKSLQAKHMCNKACGVEKMPIFSIKKKVDVAILEFISDMAGDAIFYFDEFGKMYKTEDNEEGTEELLRFFSEKGKYRRMLVATENDDKLISQYMLNRPGRFAWVYRMNKLSPCEAEDIIGQYEFRDLTKRLLNSYASEGKGVTIDMLEHACRTFHLKELHNAELDDMSFSLELDRVVSSMNIEIPKPDVSYVGIELDLDYIDGPTSLHLKMKGGKGIVTQTDARGKKVKIKHGTEYDCDSDQYILASTIDEFHSTMSSNIEKNLSYIFNGLSIAKVNGTYYLVENCYDLNIRIDEDTLTIEGNSVEIDFEKLLRNKSNDEEKEVFIERMSQHFGRLMNNNALYGSLAHPPMYDIAK